MCWTSSIMESKKQIPTSNICFKEMKATLWSSDDGQLHTTSWKAVAFDSSLLWTSSLLRKKNATTRKRKVAILFAKSAAAVSKLGSFDLKIVVDTFGLFWSWRDFADVFKWKCQVFYKYHYRENELGIPKKSMKGELCNWVCYTNSERFFFKGLSLKKKSSMDQNF